MLVLHLVIFPERVRGYASELQLGLRAVCRPDGIRFPHVHIPCETCLRGTGGEGDNRRFRVGDDGKGSGRVASFA